MKILIDLNHPAQFHLFKNTIKVLNNTEHNVFVFAKTKDILTNLLESEGIKYHNKKKTRRKNTKKAMLFSLISQEIGLFKFCMQNRPDIMLGTSIEICHIGKLLNIPAYIFNEDDAEVVPLVAKLAYPFAKGIVAPNVCSTGKWNKSKIGYEGYHELAYLHPNIFTPNYDYVKKYCGTEPYFILRFAKLEAHHDEGASGITDELAEEIISILEPYGKVFITSERSCNAKFKKYRINIPTIYMHDVMAYAQMYIGDSQTMAAEAAVLGVPALRFNSFAGKISYLEELEHKYGLTYAFLPNNQNFLINKIKEIVTKTNIKDEWNDKKSKMLSEKIELTSFIIELIENELKEKI